MKVLSYKSSYLVGIFIFLLISILLLSLFSTNLIMANEIENQPVYYFLGSSVTYGSANGGISFVDYIEDENDWKCIKKAVSGTTLVDNGATSYVQRMERQIKPGVEIDHLICQLSTNDASQNKKLGTISESKNIDEFDTKTIIGAMEYIIAYAYETWDTPVSFYTNPKYNNKIYEIMIDSLYDLQEKWNIGIIDFYNYKNMEPLSNAQLNSYMSDSIHPNAEGYKWMADVMSDYLIKYADSQNIDATDAPQEQTEKDREQRDSGKKWLLIIVLAVIIISISIKHCFYINVNKKTK